MADHAPDRLDGWKAIAEYLGRDERTVQRWRQVRAMPVHRVPGGKSGTVFAFARELDAWLTQPHADESVPADVPAADTRAPSTAVTGERRLHAGPVVSPSGTAIALPESCAADPAPAAPTPPTAPASRATRTPSRWWFMLVAPAVVTALALAGAVVWFLRQRPAASIVVEEGQLVAYAEDGHVTWRHRPESPGRGLALAEGLEAVRFYDIDGDGEKEALVAVDESRGPEGRATSTVSLSKARSDGASGQTRFSSSVGGGSNLHGNCARGWPTRAPDHLHCWPPTPITRGGPRSS